MDRYCRYCFVTRNPQTPDGFGHCIGSGNTFPIFVPHGVFLFSLSAFTAAHGMGFGGSLCADDSCKLHVSVSVTKNFLHDRVVIPLQNPQAWRTSRLLFVWPLTFDLSGMGDPTRTSRGPASIALRFIEARNPRQGGNLVRGTRDAED